MWRGFYITLLKYNSVATGFYFLCARSLGILQNFLSFSAYSFHTGTSILHDISCRTDYASHIQMHMKRSIITHFPFWWSTSYFCSSFALHTTQRSQQWMQRHRSLKIFALRHLLVDSHFLRANKKIETLALKLQVRTWSGSLTSNRWLDSSKLALVGTCNLSQNFILLEWDKHSLSRCHSFQDQGWLLEVLGGRFDANYPVRHHATKSW